MIKYFYPKSHKQSIDKSVRTRIFPFEDLGVLLYDHPLFDRF
jgi:hypothetical protein